MAASITEQHEDEPDRSHTIFISPIKFPTQENTTKKDSTENIGLEVYCDNNHWLITAPSIHENGYPYQPIGTDQIPILNEYTAKIILEILTEIYKEYGKEYKEKEEKKEKLRNNPRPIAQKDQIDNGLIELLVKVLKPYCMKEGLRNNIHFATSGYLRKSLVSYDTAKEFVKRFCEETEDDKLENRLVVLRNTYRESKEDEDIAGHSKLEELISKEDLNKLDVYIGQTYEGILSSKYNRKKQEKLNKESAITEWLIIKYHLRTLRDSEELLYYKEGVYVRGGEKLLHETIEKEYPNEYLTHEITEFVNKIKRRTFIDREEFDKDLDIFCFDNGLVNLGKPNEIKPHDPNYLCTIKYNITYDPVATAPKFESTLKQILKTQNHIDLMYESMGYSLYRSRPFDMCTMLVGSGDNGKSLITELWSEVLGHDKVSYESLKNLTNNRFATSSLVGKNLNIDVELSKDTIVDSSMFKKLNSVHMIQIEEKFKPSYSTRIYAKLVCNANRIAYTTDHSDGFYKRIRIIIFPYKFVFKPEDQLKDNEKIANPNLINELREEKAGIINLWMDALRKLLTNHPIIDVDAQRESYRLLSNPYRKYADERIEIWNKDMVSYEVLGKTGSGKVGDNIGYKDCRLPKKGGFKDFEKWCIEKNIPFPDDYDEFCRQIKMIYKDLTVFGQGQYTVEEVSKTWCWYGIRLKESLINSIFGISSDNSLKRIFEVRIYRNWNDLNCSSLLFEM